jgi:hypothetical protein
VASSSSRLLKKAHLRLGAALRRTDQERLRPTFGGCPRRVPIAAMGAPPCIWTFLSSLAVNEFFSILLFFSQGLGRTERGVRGIAGAFLTLLAQLSIGGVAAMLLVPIEGIGWGFYRTTAAIYLGLVALALWGRIWLLVQALSAGAAWGQVFQLLSVPATLALLASGFLLLVGNAALGLEALALGRDGSGLPALAILGNAWLSGALLGLTFTGMLLGHWYLNEPGLPTRHVWRMAHWFLVAVLAQGLFPSAYGLLALLAGDPALAERVLRAIPDHPVLFGARVLVGVLATLVVALVIRNTLRIPNVQSATGFFYIAILTVLLGEVLGRALFLFTGIPF